MTIDPQNLGAQTLSNMNSHRAIAIIWLFWNRNVSFLNIGLFKNNQNESVTLFEVQAILPWRHWRGYIYIPSLWLRVPSWDIFRESPLHHLSLETFIPSENVNYKKQFISECLCGLPRWLEGNKFEVYCKSCWKDPFREREKTRLKVLIDDYGKMACTRKQENSKLRRCLTKANGKLNRKKSPAHFLLSLKQ